MVILWDIKYQKSCHRKSQHKPRHLPGAIPINGHVPEEFLRPCKGRKWARSWWSGELWSLTNKVFFLFIQNLVIRDIFILFQKKCSKLFIFAFAYVSTSFCHLLVTINKLDRIELSFPIILPQILTSLMSRIIIAAAEPHNSVFENLETYGKLFSG